MQDSIFSTPSDLAIGGAVFDPLPKKTRQEVFLDEMNRVVPWTELVALITPPARGAHQALGGRPPFPVEVMLRIRSAG